MPTQVRSQLPYAEKGGWIDDCGPASLACALDYLNKYATKTTVGQAIEAATKAGRKDVDGQGNGTTFAQLKKACKFLDATVKATSPARFSGVKVALEKGGALIVAATCPFAIPKRVWSGWQVARDRSGRKTPYGHYFVLTIESGKWYYTDPTQKDGEIGKEITEAEARVIAHWGSQGALVSRNLKSPYAVLLTR
jgi:hypothetical protein